MTLSKPRLWVADLLYTKQCSYVCLSKVTTFANYDQKNVYCCTSNGHNCPYFI